MKTSNPSLKVLRNCEICNAEIVIYISELKYGRGRFCSKDCQKRWQTIPLETRFQKYIGHTTTEGCIIWTGCLNPDDYGVIGEGTRKGNMLLAHRVAYTMKNGEIPDGLCVLHRCDNPPCVNPEHLFLGTNADNMRDMVSKGRQIKGNEHYLHISPELRRGEKNPAAKLTHYQVIAIREKYSQGNVTQYQLATDYGVSQQMISCVVRHKNW